MLKLGICSLLALGLSDHLMLGTALAGPVEDLQPGQWYQVPNSHLRAVLPNPIPPGNGPDGIISAWNSGAYDTTRNRYIVWGGGHQDYAGNEIYAFALGTLQWSRIWGPSYAYPPIGTSCSTSSEAYGDGTPSSRHIYDGLEYMPNVDKLFMHHGSMWCAAGNAGKTTWTFNMTTQTWSRTADGYPATDLEEISAYDPVTGHMFVAGPGTGMELSEYNPVNNTWQFKGGMPAGYGQVGVIDPVRRKFLAVGSSHIYAFDLTSPTFARTTLTTTGDTTIVGVSRPGIAYDPASDRLVAWNGGASVYTLNLDTRAWTKVPPASTNTVIPTNPNAQGTFGRWQYVASKNVFIVVNSIDEDVYIYKLSAGGGSTDTLAPAAPTNLQIQ